MTNIVYIALGSALGGVCRYFVSLSLNSQGGFPWGTLCVNVAGSLAIGALSGVVSHCSGNAAAMRAFAIVGFCGGFTTFSTFSNELFAMLEGARIGMACAYFLVSVSAGLAGVWLGSSLR